tara:strand:+ start:2980 stop:3714 length:735 start_codon:yes stop_codon:yes gene_type:complete
MNISSLNIKIIVGTIYIATLSIGLYFLFSTVDIKDLMSYDFIRENKDIILKYKNENFLFLTFVFFIFISIWVLFLGFVIPILLLSGFVFGKWWGILIGVTSTTMGATLLYLLCLYFFKDFIREKLEPKFFTLKEFFNKNDTLYFTIFRLSGGLGAPFSIQNVLPVLFNMPIKNYAIATFIGSVPAMFVTVSLGSGIENVIDKNSTVSLSTIFYSPEIYIPIFIFFVILFIGYLLKKFILKRKKI